MLKIELIDQPEQSVIMIKAKTSVEGLPKIIGESYMKIMQYLTELKEMPLGAPYTAYYNLDMQNLDVELGFPVSKPLPDKNEIKSSIIANSKAVTTIYKGPYSGMQQSYDEITKWISDNGYEPTGVYYEFYYNSPNEVAENELLTKILIPVK